MPPGFTGPSALLLYLPDEATRTWRVGDGPGEAARGHGVHPRVGEVARAEANSLPFSHCFTSLSSADLWDLDLLATEEEFQQGRQAAGTAGWEGG